MIIEQNKQCYLLSIGANTANEERLRSVQSLQQFGQRSLKQLTTGVYWMFSTATGVCIYCKTLVCVYYEHTAVS